jgi:hypothetical protein
MGASVVSLPTPRRLRHYTDFDRDQSATAFSVCRRAIVTVQEAQRFTSTT